MILTREQQVSFARGQNDSSAPEEYAPTELAKLENGRVALDGNSARRRGGSKQTHSSALNSGAQCYGLTAYLPTGATRQIVAVFGDTIYYSTDDGASWTQIATGLSQAYWDFASMDVAGTRKLYGVNGSGIYEWDGSSWTQITGTGVPSGPTFCEVFNGRLYVAGHNEDSVKASKVIDPTTWTTAGGAFSVQVSTHAGDEQLKGLFQLGTVLLVFKRRSVGYIEGFGFETLQVEAGARGMTRSIGALGHRTIRPCGEQGVMWLSERGFEYFGLGSQEIQLASRPMQGFVDGLDLQAAGATQGLATATWYPRLGEYWCAVPTSGSSQNDRIYVFRPPSGGRPPAQWSFNPSFDVAALASSDTSSENQLPHAAGYDGLLRVMETGDKDDVDSAGSGGSDVTMTLRSRPFVYGELHRRKRARVLRAGVWNPGTVPADVDARVVYDGNTSSPQTLRFDPSSAPKTQKGRFSRRGYELHAQLETADDVKVEGMELAAEPLREAW